MSGRNHAYLDLAALPAVGPALLASRPAWLWSADGRRVLWSNAAGAAFLGEKSMAALLERRFSPALPSSEQIARFARNLPPGATRLERIRFAGGASLASLAAICTRIALPDGAAAVLLVLEPPRGPPSTLEVEAERLVELLGAEDCLIAVLDEDGEVIAASGGLETLAAGEAAIEDLLVAAERSDDRLVKRAIRIDDRRRPAGLARIPLETGSVHLLIVGPAERIVVEPVAETRPSAPVPPVAAAEVSLPPIVEVQPAVPREAVVPETVSPAKTDIAAPAEAAPPSIAAMSPTASAEEPSAAESPARPAAEPQEIEVIEAPTPAVENTSPAPDAVAPEVAVAEGMEPEPAEAAAPSEAPAGELVGSPETEGASPVVAGPAEPMDAAPEAAGETSPAVEAPQAADVEPRDAEPAEPVGATESAELMGPAEPVDPAAAAEPAGSEAEFHFVEPVGPRRFVFQMDAEGRFTFVSPDFARAVGPISAGIVGSLWRDVALRRGFDRDGSVAAIIARRDTWSGVSLAWPVDGSSERVAVDLAALPAFSRDRTFEGYRGFGVIRPRDRRREPEPQPVAVAAPPPAAQPPATAPPTTQPMRPTLVSVPKAIEPSNVVRLPRAGGPVDAEMLSVPEQDAFRRIAAALGATPADATKPADAAKPADTTRPADTTKPADTIKPAEPADAADAAKTAVAEPQSDMAPPPVAPVPTAVAREVAGSGDEVTAAKAQAAAVAEAEASQAIAAAPSLSTLEERPAPVATGPVPVVGPDAGLIVQLAEAGQKIVELEAILDTATDGVIVVDGEGLVERINRSAEALFGVDTASVAGLRFTELLAEESRKSALDYLDGLARNGVASVLNDGREVIGRVPQGGLIPLFMTMGRLAETGKFCAVLRDITQWKNAEGELINARRAAESASMQKSDFLAKVSHEIRTPLNAIIGFSEVMMEERFGPIGTERYKEYLRDIHISGAHLMSLLNDLLDLSKIEAGKLDLTFEAVPLNELVMECVALMQPQANRERIIIRTSLSAQVPSIVADPRSIRQIVLNLVSNAVKFTLAGGQVIVSTVMEERGEVTLRIRDTGVGMSEKDIETALKPFRQLTSASKPRSDGTGLGLPLTKALVEANRAAFSIDSTVGQGTLIRITFPATRVLAE